MFIARKGKEIYLIK